MKKNKKERHLFNLLCDLESALYKEDNVCGSVDESLEKSYNEVGKILDKWESYLKVDEA